MAKAVSVASCLTLILGVWCAQSGAAAVAVRSAVGFYALVRLDDCGLTVTEDTDVESQGAALAPLAVSVSANQACGDNWSTSSGHVEASWADVSSGAVHVEASLDHHDDYPWQGYYMRYAGAAEPTYPGSDLPCWVYTFVPDTDGSFRLSYSSSHVGFDADSWVIYGISFNGQGASIAARDNGSVCFSFSRGETCTVRLFTGTSWGGGSPSFYTWQTLSCSWEFDTAAVPVLGTTWGSVKALYSE